jgi:peroxidase
MKSFKMAMANLMTMFMLIEVITCGFGFGFGADGGLNMNYYLMSCPFVEPVVKNVVNRALDNDPTLAAALVRMHFHDCFIQVILKGMYFFSFFICPCNISYYPLL